MFNTLLNSLYQVKNTPLARPPIMIDNYSYRSHNTARPGRARPPPRPGGAAGRRHADHAPKLADASLSVNTRRAYLGALRALGRLAGGRPG